CIPLRCALLSNCCRRSGNRRMASARIASHRLRNRSNAASLPSAPCRCALSRSTTVLRCVCTASCFSAWATLLRNSVLIAIPFLIFCSFPEQFRNMPPWHDLILFLHNAANIHQTTAVLADQPLRVRGAHGSGFFQRHGGGNFRL